MWISVHLAIIVLCLRRCCIRWMASVPHVRVLRWTSVLCWIPVLPCMRFFVTDHVAAEVLFRKKHTSLLVLDADRRATASWAVMQ